MATTTVQRKPPARPRRAADPTLARFRRILRRRLPALKETYGVRSLWLFGSYVRGEARKRSDLDILVEYDQAPSFFELIELEERLSSLLGTKVDLVMKSALKPRIGERILAEVVPV
jgi:predicted nucleotidyltransferase